QSYSSVSTTVGRKFFSLKSSTDAGGLIRSAIGRLLLLFAQRKSAARPGTNSAVVPPGLRASFDAPHRPLTGSAIRLAGDFPAWCQAFSRSAPATRIVRRR